MTENILTIKFNLDELLDQIVQRTGEVIPFDSAGIDLYDAKEQLLTPICYRISGTTPIFPVTSGVDEDAAWRVAQTHEPYLLSNKSADGEPTSNSGCAQMAAPILLNDTLLGVFFVESCQPDSYSRQLLAILCSFADQAALALHTAGLHEVLAQRFEWLNEYNEQLVLRNEISRMTASGQPIEVLMPQVAQKLTKLIHADACAFALWDEKRGRTQRLAASGIDLNDYLSERRRPLNTPSLTKDIVEGGHTYIFNDAQTIQPPPTPLIEEFEAHAVLAMPFSARGRPIGATFLMNLTPNRPFTQANADQIASVLDQLALALDNSQLLKDTQTRLGETSLLLEIAAIASSSLQLNDMLAQVFKLSQKMLGVSTGAIMIYERNTNMLVTLPGAGFGFSPEVLQTRFPVNDPNSHIALVFTSGTGYFTNDLFNTVHETYRGLAFKANIRNLLVAPLRVQDEPMGVFIVGDKAGDFTRTDLDLMAAMGSHIAAALRNADLLNVMRQRADLMSLINKISQDLSATLDLPGLMRKVVRAVYHLLGYDAAHFHVLDEMGTTLSSHASASAMPELLVEEGFTFPVTRGLAGRAIRERKTQLVFDVRGDPDFLWPVVNLPAASALVVLLQNRERILGAIEIISFRPDAFQESDVTALETLATQVSTVIENARLWDQAQRRLLEQGIVHQIGQDLTSILDYIELANAVVRHMTRALDTALCLFISVDVDTQQLRVEAEYRAPEIARNSLPRLLGQAPVLAERELVEKAIETRRQKIVYWGHEIAETHRPHFETLGITAEMALPMIAGDRVIGCMVWIETRAVRKFSDSDIRLAQTLTTQASIAIENARLYGQAQRQAREQALLRRVTMNLSALSDMGELLRQYPREVLQAMAANNVMLSMRDDDGIFRVKGHALTTRAPNQMFLGRVQRELNATWALLKNNLSIQRSSILPVENAAHEEMAQVMSDVPGVFVLVPIMRRGEAFGLIELSRDDPRSLFDAQERSFLEALANQGAVAIDNVGLYQREQRRLRQLEKVQISSRLLAGQLQTDALLSMIVSEASTIFESPAVSLLIIVPETGQYVRRAAVGLSDRFMADSAHAIPQSGVEGPVYTADLRDQSTITVAAHEQIRSALVVPVNKAGQHLGLLTLYSVGQVRAFTDEEMELAQLFAGQAGVALENARLFETLEQRAIELAKANQLKSEFLARVSHELRTPMNSINGYSEMLLRNTYGTVNDKQTDRLERILRNGRNLLALIDDLLDISKIDAGKMELRIQSVNLRDELNATIYALEAQAVSRDLYLKVEAPADLPLVLADPMRLKQILTNLLGNAIKFTKTGGVTVHVRVQDDYGRPMLWTEVVDTGIGISQQDQQIIFDEFRQADGSATREYGGTGLGLAITKKLVELMGGRVWVESELDHGSRFIFILPLATSTDKTPA